ncbi:hypothetical protein LB577_05125 [Mesorhizobium sp. B283B1A]|uniref:hypothetical protein n=1 Tax=Mesorhizobium TaxID=68287 RepID=UPI001CD116BE|nr:MULTISPECIES: hypothetical protein [Mesorhizobium]MCA0046337.1 hypothetical protein [Mesorhizobium sp. B283B1A]UQS68218.1 hypothetical protein M5D98_30230 [Mesorhizobium opportunistum]
MLPNLVTVNGVRVVAQDGTWGLAGVENPISSDRGREMFEALDAVPRRNPEVGVYNQTF